MHIKPIPDKLILIMLPEIDDFNVANPLSYYFRTWYVINKDIYCFKRA